MLDYVSTVNDREQKILDFKHPTQLREQIDFDIPEHPLPVEQLLEDCKLTLANQVKTGECLLKTPGFLVLELKIRRCRRQRNLCKNVNKDKNLVFLHDLCQVSLHLFPHAQKYIPAL